MLLTLCKMSARSVGQGTFRCITVLRVCRWVKNILFIVEWMLFRRFFEVESLENAFLRSATRSPNRVSAKQEPTAKTSTRPEKSLESAIPQGTQRLPHVREKPLAHVWQRRERFRNPSATLHDSLKSLAASAHTTRLEESAKTLFGAPRQARGYRHSMKILQATSP